MRRRVAIGILAVVLLGVVAWHATLGAQRTAQRGAHGRHGDASQAIPVRVAAVRKGSIERTVDALGTVTAFNTVTVHSRVDGPLVDVPLKEGQLVRAGDLLARIDPSTFEVAVAQAAAQLARDQAQLAGARVDLERYRGLLKQDSVSKQLADQQRFTVQQLQGTVRADRASLDNARLQLQFTRITAPISGRVGLRQVDVGNLVHASDTNGVVVITQTQPVNVMFALPSDRLSDVLSHSRNGQTLLVEALDRDGKLLAQGTLAAIDNQIDVATGTMKLKAEFPNTDDALFADQFVNVRLDIETVPGATLVPSAAIQRGAPGTFVYVVNRNSTVAMRPATLGPASGDTVSITRGVKPGDRVVIDGTDKLRDGAAVAVIPDKRT